VEEREGEEMQGEEGADDDEYENAAPPSLPTTIVTGVCSTWVTLN
jgi:hypothetical protein